MTNTHDALMTPAEIAVRLRVSLRQVKRLRAHNKLPPAIRIGRLLRYSTLEVERWIARGGTTPRVYVPR